MLIENNFTRLLGYKDPREASKEYRHGEARTFLEVCKVGEMCTAVWNLLVGFSKRRKGPYVDLSRGVNLFCVVKKLALGGGGKS